LSRRRARFHPDPWNRGEDQARGDGSRDARLDLEGQSIAVPEFRSFDCYLYGNEARGLPRAVHAAVPTTAFTIPGSGAIESLNVAASVNICQYELARNCNPVPQSGDA
jgi:TrmH family RNA methyltransferase